jgi:hypothetical protein
MRWIPELCLLLRHHTQLTVQQQVQLETQWTYLFCGFW